ncbi:MAG: hypothetical protein J6U82_06245 [Alistipes sp.]|nr:hypothetical protein [Alistipes sp.]
MRDCKLIRFCVVVALLLCVVAFPARVRAEEPYKNGIKITFLSWATGSTKISYERAFPEIKQSAEICSSLISAGYDKYQNDPMGFTLRYSHKFFVGPYDTAKPLQGAYLRPEVIYSDYKYTHSVTGRRTPARMCALLATAGYQHCFGHFVVDGWVGGGYAFGKASETGYHHGFQLWKWLGKRNDNIALSFSIRIGYIW